MVRDETKNLTQGAYIYHKYKIPRNPLQKTTLEKIMEMHRKHVKSSKRNSVSTVGVINLLLYHEPT